MKIIFLTILVMSLGTLSFAQQRQKYPSTPTTSTKTSTSSSTNSNYLRTVSDNNGNDDGNLSIAISESDGSYKLRAKFPAKNDLALKELLINEFGKENAQLDGNDWEWTLASDSDEIYSIKFSSGKLEMELDKEQATQTLTEKFIRIGKEIKELISGEEDQNTEALELKAERLQKDAQRMQREAENLEKQIEQKFPNNEVKALKLKVQELQQKVDSLQQELNKHKEN